MSLSPSFSSYINTPSVGYPNHDSEPMKDFPSCFGESGTQVADFSSSSSPPANRPSASQGHVTCVYHHQSQVFSGFITVTWVKHLRGDGFIVELDKSSKETLCKVEIKPWLFSKRRGLKNVLAASTQVEIRWDLSSARFGASPEPVDGFFLAVTLNQQPCLVLGDHAHKIRSIASAAPPKPNLIARREHVSGKRLYSSKAQFCSSHQFHDLKIEYDSSEGSVFAIYIDNNVVLQVDHLKWKFRGNQRILVDGVAVEVYWDVYSWIFGRSVDHAVFLFRSYRCDFTAKDDSSSDAAAAASDSYGFSFVLCAWKNE